MGPRNDEGPQLELQQGMMANFRKRKKEREAGNLAGSEEDGDVGGAHLCFPHPSSSFSYDVPASLSKTWSYAHSHCCFSRVACLELRR